MIFYLGNKVDKVNKIIRLNRNMEKSWDYGYDASIDTVIISKDGTLGEIYNICGLNIGLPAIPEKEMIKNWDKTHINQKWKRDELPAGLTADNMNNAQYRDYVKQQFEYRANGYWVYLNGVPVYLTGIYWFFIQWVRIEEDYPNLRIIQNELMIFWEACKADSRSYGMQYVKNRRIGASSLAVAELLFSGTTFHDKELGIISKTGDDASDIFQRIVTSFRRLPPFFQPMTDSGSDNPKTVLVFREPSKKGNTKGPLSQSGGLNTTIEHYSTTKNAMDGKRIFRSLIDEAGKYPSSVPFDKYWSVVKTSHQKGRVIFGKAMVVSTVNAMKDGGAEFKNIWDNSDVNERNDNDMTISGLYRIFIPAKYCMEGYFDQYGFSIVKDPESKILADDGTYVKIGSETYLKNVLESLKHKPEEYNEQLRQFPDTPKDAFRDVTDGCAFNLIHLQEQIDFNQIELNDKFYADTNDLRKKQSYFGNDQVMRGNFRWRGGVKDTVPEWYPDKENGRFYILKDCLPNEEDRGKKVWKRTISGTGWTPTMSHIGCFGVDPYDRSFTSDGRGSKGAIHLVTRTSASHYPNDTFILEYIDRPKSIDIFIEDVIMAMVFFSMPVLPEMSNIVLLKTLKDRGYRNFVVNNPLKKTSELKPNELDLGGFPQQGKGGQDAQYTILEKYIEDHVGVGRDGAERGAGVMGTMPFTRTLIQWKDVDLNDRTDFDAYISGSLALLGLNTAPKIKEVKQVEKFSLFPQYDNTGQISKIVC